MEKVRNGTIAWLSRSGVLSILLRNTGKSFYLLKMNRMGILNYVVVVVVSLTRWGQPWNHGDYQHTSMGIIWWIAGLVGLVLSRNGRRSVIPSILIMLTAVAFQGHAQHVANSAQIHSYFGYMLMAGALSRIIEICFVWKEGDFTISPWQYIPPLVCERTCWKLVHCNLCKCL